MSILSRPRAVVVDVVVNVVRTRFASSRTLPRRSESRKDKLVTTSTTAPDLHSTPQGLPSLADPCAVGGFSTVSPPPGASPAGRRTVSSFRCRIAGGCSSCTVEEYQYVGPSGGDYWKRLGGRKGGESRRKTHRSSTVLSALHDILELGPQRVDRLEAVADLSDVLNVAVQLVHGGDALAEILSKRGKGDEGQLWCGIASGRPQHLVTPVSASSWLPQLPSSRTMPPQTAGAYLKLSLSASKAESRRVYVPLQSLQRACRAPCRSLTCRRSSFRGEVGERDEVTERGGGDRASWELDWVVSRAVWRLVEVFRRDWLGGGIGLNSTLSGSPSPAFHSPRSHPLDCLAMAVPSSTSLPPAKQTTPIQLYHQSSQYRSVPILSSLSSLARPSHPLALCSNWRYSWEELDKIREDLNAQAVERVRSGWEAERVRLHFSPSLRL